MQFVFTEKNFKTGIPENTKRRKENVGSVFLYPLSHLDDL